MDEIPTDRVRKIPKRYEQGSANHTFSSNEDKYRAEYFAVIDSTIESLKQYFDSPDIREYKILSDMLLKGVFNADACSKYPEFDDSIEHQIKFFHTQFGKQVNNLNECRLMFKNFVPEVRIMFTQVEGLLRLLLQSPASSCTAERSFSALRRLKTWLRSTMGQDRLEALMICHVHRSRLMAIDPKEIARIFINDGNTDVTLANRKRLFGCI